MKWTGHLIRSSDNTPAKTALKHLNKEKKDLEVDKGKPGKQWWKKNLNNYYVNWDSATEMAKEENIGKLL